MCFVEVKLKDNKLTKDQINYAMNFYGSNVLYYVLRVYNSSFGLFLHNYDRKEFKIFVHDNLFDILKFIRNDLT